MFPSALKLRKMLHNNICSSSLVILLTSLVNVCCLTDPVSCPYGGSFEPNLRQCFVVIEQSVQWGTANDSCVNNYSGGNLATVNSLQVQTVLENLLSNR